MAARFRRRRSSRGFVITPGRSPECSRSRTSMTASCTFRRAVHAAVPVRAESDPPRPPEILPGGVIQAGRAWRSTRPFGALAVRTAFARFLDRARLRSDIRRRFASVRRRMVTDVSFQSTASTRSVQRCRTAKNDGEYRNEGEPDPGTEQKRCATASHRKGASSATPDRPDHASRRISGDAEGIALSADRYRGVKRRGGRCSSPSSRCVTGCSR